MNNVEIPKVCKQCRSPVKCIPAGVSKRTGKRYPTFYACEDKNCSWTFNPDSPSTGARGVKDAEQDLDQFEELMAKLDNLNERFNKLGEYLATEFKALNKKIDGKSTKQDD